MRNIKYTSTDCFKVGDSVWVTGIKFTPSGRLKYLVRPLQTTIKEVQDDRIVINDIYRYHVPLVYYIDNVKYDYFPGSDDSISRNIALTKEEAAKNLNGRIEEEIEKRYNDFRDFEKRAKSCLL